MTTFVDLPNPAAHRITAAELTAAFNDARLGVVAVKDFGAKGDATTDDTAAIQAAFTAALTGSPLGAKVKFSAGRFVLSAAIVLSLANTALVIEGEGENATELVWLSNTDGFTVTYASSAWWNRGPFSNQAGGIGGTGAGVCFRGLSLISDNQLTGGVCAGAAIRITGDTISGRVGPSTLFRDLVITGASDKQQWSDGLVLLDVGYSEISGLNSTISAASGVGNHIRMSGVPGSQESVDHHWENIRATGGNNGIVLSNGVQGVSLEQYTCVAANYGVSWIVSPGTSEDSLTILGGHISTNIAGIVTSNVYSVVAADTYYLPRSVPGVAWTGISITDAGLCNISGNIMRGQHASATPETGISISRSAAVPVQYSMLITGNQICNMQTMGVSFGAGFAGQVYLSGNVFQYNGANFSALPAGAVFGANFVDSGNQINGNLTISGYLQATAGLNGTDIGQAVRGKLASTDLDATGAVIFNGQYFRLPNVPVGDPHIVNVVYRDATTRALFVSAG